MNQSVVICTIPSYNVCTEECQSFLKTRLRNKQFDRLYAHCLLWTIILQGDFFNDDRELPENNRQPASQVLSPVWIGEWYLCIMYKQYSRVWLQCIVCVFLYIPDHVVDTRQITNSGCSRVTIVLTSCMHFMHSFDSPRRGPGPRYGVCKQWNGLLEQWYSGMEILSSFSKLRHISLKSQHIYITFSIFVAHIHKNLTIVMYLMMSVSTQYTKRLENQIAHDELILANREISM